MIKINLKIVYGPPCSGKTTYVKENIIDGDIVIDLDYLKHALTYKEYHADLESEELDYLWDIRNHIIANPKENATTWLITTVEVEEDLSIYEKVETIEMDVSKEEVYRYIEDDESREDKEFWKELVDKWFNENANQKYLKGGDKMKNKRYFSLFQDTESKTADIYIYGDITSWEWLASDVSSYTLSKELQELQDVEEINVYISSYGGEVKEGLAIYKALKRHKARVITFADGFACSIASVIFAAGDERVMSDMDLLMIHNAWTYTAGDSNDLRKQADELEKMTQRSINAYMDIVNIDEDELKSLMDTDTWIDGEEALEMGFATRLEKSSEKEVATQSVRKSLMQKIKKSEKEVAAKVDTEEGQIEKIVEKAVKQLEQQLVSQGVLEIEEASEKPEPAPIEEIPGSKPLNMMRALFNFKEEE